MQSLFSGNSRNESKYKSYKKVLQSVKGLQKKYITQI